MGADRLGASVDHSWTTDPGPDKGLCTWEPWYHGRQCLRFAEKLLLLTDGSGRSGAARTIHHRTRGNSLNATTEVKRGCTAEANSWSMLPVAEASALGGSCDSICCGDSFVVGRTGSAGRSCGALCRAGGQVTPAAQCPNVCRHSLRTFLGTSM